MLFRSNDKSFMLKIAGNARKDVERVYESFVDQSHTHQILRFIDVPLVNVN